MAKRPPVEQARAQLSHFLRSWADDYENSKQPPKHEADAEGRAEFIRLMRAAATFVENGGELPTREVGKAPELGMGYCGERLGAVSGDPYDVLLPIARSAGGHAS